MVGYGDADAESIVVRANGFCFPGFPLDLNKTVHGAHSRIMFLCGASLLTYMFIIVYMYIGMLYIYKFTHYIIKIYIYR